MRKCLVLGVVVLLGGCATTPDDIVSSGAIFDVPMKQSPEATATCISRNGVNTVPGLAQLRYDLSDAVEVIFQQGALDGVLIVVRLPKDRDVGSIAISRRVLFESNRQQLFNKLIAGC